jgi:hypothetical protein
MHGRRRAGLPPVRFSAWLATHEVARTSKQRVRAATGATRCQEHAPPAGRLLADAVVSQPPAEDEPSTVPFHWWGYPQLAPASGWGKRTEFTASPDRARSESRVRKKHRSEVDLFGGWGHITSLLGAGKPRN